MKVFLANPNTRYDLSALGAYGKIEYLSEEFLNPFNTDSVISALREGFLNFDAETDVLCMTGNLQIVAFMLMIAHDLFDSFRILMFDATTSNYRERVITHD